MNQYIESDIHNGITFLKCAVMNMLHELETDKCSSIKFPFELSDEFIKQCLDERGWTIVKDCDTWTCMYKYQTYTYYHNLKLLESDSSNINKFLDK